MFEPSTVGSLLQGAPFLLAFIVGACVGSFLNVCITRIPERESVVVPGSHCRSCGTPVALSDNIPLISFLWLRGRCRACGAPIPVRYLIVELLTAALAVILLLRWGASWPLVVHSVFVGGLVVVSFVDLEAGIVPDRISLSGIALGIALSLSNRLFGRADLPAPLDSLLGVLLGGGLLLAVAWVYERVTGREGLGMGDVKLLAMIGAFLGWASVPVTLFVGALAGSAWGIGLMLVKGVDSKHALPFAPFLCAGALCALFWGPDFAVRHLTLAGQ